MDLGPCFSTDGTGKSEAPQTGTTIVAVSFNGGVVIGADGRVSTGTYISNRASNKIQQLTDNVFLLRSGSAADTQAIGDYGARGVAGRWCSSSSVASVLLLRACEHRAGPLLIQLSSQRKDAELFLATSTPKPLYQPSPTCLNSALLLRAAGMRVGAASLCSDSGQASVHGA